MPGWGLLLLQLAPVLIPPLLETVKKFPINGASLKDKLPNGVSKWLWPAAAVGVNGLLHAYPETSQVILDTIQANPTISTGLMSVGAFSLTKNLRQSAQSAAAVVKK